MKKRIENYIKDIQSERIPSCKWVKLAVKRYLSDFDNPNLVFDQESAEHIIKVFENYFRHSKGEWAGKLFVLSDWEIFILWNVFGWRNKDGTRRFKTAYIEVARKNGKTTLMSGVGIYLLGFDGEPGAEIYSAATKRDQARLSHSEATRMVKASPELRQFIKVYKDNLHIEEKACKFEPLGADANTMDGLNVHGALIDELHAHPNRKVWDVLETATGARREPLVFAISTAGFDKHTVCWEVHEYLEKILEGSVEDETFFGMIFTLDQDDDWKDERNWIKANPNLDVSAKREDMRRKARRAEQIPSALNGFLRLHMNVWTESVTRWIPGELWAKCGGEIQEDKLIGRVCYSGLDLSSTKDLTALVHVFPPNGDGKYIILPRFFIPLENMQKRVYHDRVPYDVWVREGYINATVGNVIDYSFVLDQIDKDAQKFDMRELAFDRWGATKVMQDLQDMGFERESDNKYASRYLVAFGQGYASMSPPTKELEKMILSGEINHGNNPVLNWMISNVVIREDPSGNIKVDKGVSTERVDGIVAAIMGLDRALRFSDSEADLSITIL